MDILAPPQLNFTQPLDILSSILASEMANVVNGDVADPHMFPYQARVIRKGSYCGGVVLSTLHILTAAHCVLDPPNSITVFAGDHDRLIVEKNEQKRVAAEVIIHPDYNSYTHE